MFLDHDRTRQRWWRIFVRSLDARLPESAEPSAEADRRDHQQYLAQRLQSALSKLSPEDRALVHLHYYEDQSLAEIALVLGLSRDALKMRLSRARAKLRTVLRDRDECF